MLENRAISLYGSERPTFIPYVTGFLTAAFLLVKAAQLIPKNVPENRSLSKSLIILAILLVGLTITPIYA